MSDNLNSKISSLVIWTLFAGLVFLYIRFFPHLKTIGEIVISALPSIIFFTIGIFISRRDQDRITQARKKDSTQISLTTTLEQALKHDLLTYLVPVIILATPFLFDQIPNVTTVIQAGTAFLVLAYLKLIYWGEL
ncbi:MAG: hypothetical protein HUU49_02090 [Candidatus Buchananbacteria bacterium]|nr:hypothetical protein [Candidatus Buchananbacteria bacterium]